MFLNCIITKFAEKMGREYPACQPFCNADTALVWLYLYFYVIILFGIG